MKRTPLVLTNEQRNVLEQFTTTGVRSARLLNRAKVILALDTSDGRRAMKQEEIARLVGVSRNSVNVIRREFLAEESVSAFLQRKKRETPPVAPKITGEVEAKIIALACSAAPEGCSRWTLRLLADKAVELCIVDSVSSMTVHSILKKRNLSLT